jgi:hypothetical protein
MDSQDVHRGQAGVDDELFAYDARRGGQARAQNGSEKHHHADASS